MIYAHHIIIKPYLLPLLLTSLNYVQIINHHYQSRVMQEKLWSKIEKLPKIKENNKKPLDCKQFYINFQLHGNLPIIQIMSRPCNREFGWVLTITYRNKNVLLKLYKPLVWPHLEYCVSAWSPTILLQRYKVLIERIQHRILNISLMIKDLIIWGYEHYKSVGTVPIYFVCSSYTKDYHRRRSVVSSISVP